MTSTIAKAEILKQEERPAAAAPSAPAPTAGAPPVARPVAGKSTFTVLLNHELGATAGVARAHGSTGGFVSEWVIRKSDLAVLSGGDLASSHLVWDNVANVYTSGIGKRWDAATNSYVASAASEANSFARLCSADLPAVSAFYNAASGLGTTSRIFMNGEETGAEGRAYGFVATGADKGKAYELNRLGKFSWENSIANPYSGDKTVVIGNNDGGTGIQNNSISVYVGTKTNTGTEVDKAGLTNGSLYHVKVNGVSLEDRTVGSFNGAAFSLSTNSATTFLRPEDGAWSTTDTSKFYFVTTDRASATGTGTGAQTSQAAASRLWELDFTDITNPTAGGTINLLIDGAAGGVGGVRPEMMDNIAFDDVTGDIIISEDVGNNARNGRIWSYSTTNGSLTEIARHFSKNGDVGIAATSPFNQDEEISGQIDVTNLFAGVSGYDTSAYRYFLMVDQQHSTTGQTNLTVEGGQLMLMAKPVPVPAAVWLLGSAMAGFAGLRRKRA
jgi:hypothetical protein